MPTLTITKTYSDAHLLNEVDLENLRTGTQNFINGGQIGSDNIKPSGVITTNLGNNAVTSAKIFDAAVDSTKLSSDSLVDDNRSVDTDHIRDAAVTTPKLATGTVVSLDFASGAVTSTKIANSAVTLSKLSSDISTLTSFSSGRGFPSGTGFFDVNDVSLNVTNQGRGVLIFLYFAGTNKNLPAQAHGGTTSYGGSIYNEYALLRDGAPIAAWLASLGAAVSAPAGGTVGADPVSIFFDEPGAGLHVYKLQMKTTVNNPGSGTVFIDYTDIRMSCVEIY